MADVTLEVRVTPRASRSEIAGWRDGVLLVRLHAAPADGAANAELVEVIADALHVPKRGVAIVSGERGRTKRVTVSGLDRATIERRLPRAKP